MTRRGGALLAVTLTAFLCALSTGSRLYYCIALCFLLVLATGLASLPLMKRLIRVECTLSPHSVNRGESAKLQIRIVNRCLWPLKALCVQVRMGDVVTERQVKLFPMRESSLTVELPGVHVGAFLCGVEGAFAEDVFGVVKAGIRHDEKEMLLSLPLSFPVEEITFSPGDTGKAALTRAQEDYTSPEDVRAYIPGDAMKRIHWKLSSRKGEMLVRRYETPAPPDTLILVDQRAPQHEETEKALYLRDAVCETAVAVADMQLRDQSPVRAPFYGRYANEFAADQAVNVNYLKEMLALQPFDGQEDFARTLQLELRRMGRTGAVIVITTYLTPNVVEAISRIRRMGPHVRLYLVSFDPENETLQPFVGQLQHHLVEVCYVTPA